MEFSPLSVQIDLGQGAPFAFFAVLNSPRKDAKERKERKKDQAQ